MKLYDYTSPDFLPPFFHVLDLPRIATSERKMLAATLRSSNISQPQLCKLSGLAQQSVSRLTVKFVELGIFIPESQPNKGRRGPPSMLVRLNPEFAYTMGVAMMTDAIEVALMDFAGNVIDQVHHQMNDMGQENFIARLKSVKAEFIEKHSIAEDRFFGLGVGISGYALGGRARYNTPKGLGEWALIDMDEVIGEHLKLPVWVENDANAAAIGENLVGAGRRYSDFVYVFVDAGIGGGVIIDHKLLHGPHHNGGEIGLLLPNDPMYGQPTLESLRDNLSINNIESHDISDMLDRFDINWPGVNQWVENSKNSFSLMSSAISAILDTQAIVLGGRLPKPLAELIMLKIEIFDDQRRAEPRPKPRIILSQTNGNACAIGAAMLPFNRFFFSTTT